MAAVAPKLWSHRRRALRAIGAGSARGLGLALAIAVGALSCATYRDDLRRGQAASDTNAHEQALAVFRVLERDWTRFTPAERAQYAYLRGMNDYRIGYKSDARHWLLIARALEDGSPGQLPADWSPRLAEALAVLDEEVRQRGIESL